MRSVGLAGNISGDAAYCVAITGCETAPTAGDKGTCCCRACICGCRPGAPAAAGMTEPGVVTRGADDARGGLVLTDEALAGEAPRCCCCCCCGDCGCCGCGCCCPIVFDWDAAETGGPLGVRAPCGVDAEEPPRRGAPIRGCDVGLTLSPTGPQRLSAFGPDTAARGEV